MKKQAVVAYACESVVKRAVAESQLIRDKLAIADVEGDVEVVALGTLVLVLELVLVVVVEFLVPTPGGVALPVGIGAEAEREFNSWIPRLISET